MKITRIKGTGVADVDKMRQAIAFTNADRRKWEKVYQAIRSGKKTISV